MNQQTSDPRASRAARLMTGEPQTGAATNPVTVQYPMNPASRRVRAVKMPNGKEAATENLANVTSNAADAAARAAEAAKVRISKAARSGLPRRADFAVPAETRKSPRASSRNASRTRR
ncbi:MAG: hypothetical protein IT337_11900 [Thermomicrobiales bacterium]|nr:hypothetical protein [Thermomicrobiales bacterium]